VVPAGQRSGLSYLFWIFNKRIWAMAETGQLNWVVAAKVADVTADAPQRFVVDQTVIGIYRVGDAFFAINDICTHQFAYLSEGYIEDGVVECPLHQATFDLRTGKALCGPAKRDLQTYPTKVVGEEILVAL
jgi:3-phenylpropionate/trans-cinnamate dioxygenase ferredoxin subunit